LRLNLWEGGTTLSGTATHLLYNHLGVLFAQEHFTSAWASAAHHDAAFLEQCAEWLTSRGARPTQAREGCARGARGRAASVALNERLTAVLASEDSTISAYSPSARLASPKPPFSSARHASPAHASSSACATPVLVDTFALVDGRCDMCVGNDSVHFERLLHREAGLVLLALGWRDRASN